MDRLHARGKPVKAPPVMVRLQGHVLFVGAVVYALRRKRESRAGAREVDPAGALGLAPHNPPVRSHISQLLGHCSRLNNKA